MIRLPVTVEELDTIIEAVKHIRPDLYAKLWSYKVNYLKDKG